MSENNSELPTGEATVTPEGATYFEPTLKPEITSKLRYRSRYLYLALVFVFVLLISFLFWQARRGEPSQKESLPVKVETVMTPTVTPAITPVSTARWSLKRQTADGLKTILVLNGQSDSVVGFDNFLVYSLVDGENPLRIFGYDLVKGERRTLYDPLNYPGDFVGASKEVMSVERIQLVEGGLYFSLGGYMTKGFLYWLPSPYEPPRKILAVENPKIIKMGKYYWVVGGEGDGCGGYRKYYLFNLITKQVNFITQANLGCLEGEEVLGVDQKERLLVASHFTNENAQNPDSGLSQTYLTVTALPLEAPSNRQKVITNDQMPADITGIRLLEQNDQLLLSGPTSYLYEIKTGTIMPYVGQSASPTPIESRLTFEQTVEKLVLPADYQFVQE